MAIEKAVKLQPVIKSYIWGGDFFRIFKKCEEKIVSELWELSVREDASSVIVSGPFSGQKLFDVLSEEDLGINCQRFPYFPLLIKLIDAKENLSVQVHPSDDYALKYENSFGKSEMWHIISADENAGLYVGLNNDYSKEEIEAKLRDGSILSALNFFKVKPGDTFVIEPGTIHAIGAGVRLIEIQQNSNLTYRLFDYLRKDKNGNYRELHIDKALKVINYKKYSQREYKGSLLADTPYFKVERKEFDGELVLTADKGSFISFTFIDGEGMVDDIKYQVFDTFFLPDQKSCVINGKGAVIISSI